MMREFLKRVQGIPLWNEINSLPAICQIVREFQTEMQATIICRYPQLRHEKLKLWIDEVVELVLFPKLYEKLYQQYAATHETADRKFNENSAKNRSKSTKELFPETKVTAVSKVAIVVLSVQKDVSEASDLLLAIDDLKTPMQKTASIVQASQALCKSAGAQLSADDLLPLLVQAAICSEMRRAASEAHFMMDFLNDQQSKGPEGWAVAAFVTAVEYIVNLK
jgi:hypothetical protein